MLQALIHFLHELLFPRYIFPIGKGEIKSVLPLQKSVSQTLCNFLQLEDQF